jgi:hypothetical protein
MGLVEHKTGRLRRPLASGKGWPVCCATNASQGVQSGSDGGSEGRNKLAGLSVALVQPNWRLAQHKHPVAE